jgi:molybdopterin/thiamine biosynthesis adenylyltransferase
MADALTFMELKRRQALNLVAAWVTTTVPGAGRLDPTALRAVGRDESWDGWRLPLSGASGGELFLMLDAEFPYSLPRFVLGGRVDLLRAPHVEAKGYLCLAGDSGRVDTLDPIAVLAHSYNEALSLVASDEAGENREDFVTDFDAYWRRDVISDLPVRTWLRTEPRSRIVAAWHGQRFYLIAESADDCRHWMTNRYGADEKRSFKEAAVIWLESLPEPDAYPDNARLARQLICDCSSDGLTVFDRLMATMTDRAVVILMGSTLTGEITQAALLVEDPNRASGAGAGPKQKATRGFRPGRVPPDILALRRPARRTPVERVDAWLSRMRGGQGETLTEKRVAVLGCGSLGAGVAKLLLQSGVGSMLLVDPDKFAWANVGRHELGVDSVGENKAMAVVERFKPMYPHVRELRAEGLTWQGLLRRQPDAFDGCDLVLSLIGAWNAESALNDLQRSGSGELAAPILYSWLEEQAGAAHALAIAPTGACLRCGFGPTGTIHVPATIWTAKRATCGAPTSIYGAAELAPAQSLVAALAIDLLLARATAPLRRAWLAPLSVLAHGGGHWSPHWVERFGDPGPGGLLTATPWPEDHACPSSHQPATSGALSTVPVPSS